MPAATCLGPTDLQWGRTSGSCHRGPVEFIRLKQVETWSCGGRVLHRNSGTCCELTKKDCNVGPNCPPADPLLGTESKLGKMSLRGVSRQGLVHLPRLMPQGGGGVGPNIGTAVTVGHILREKNGPCLKATQFNLSPLVPGNP